MDLGIGTTQNDQNGRGDRTYPKPAEPRQFNRQRRAGTYPIPIERTGEIEIALIDFLTGLHLSNCS